MEKPPCPTGTRFLPFDKLRAGYYAVLPHGSGRNDEVEAMGTRFLPFDKLRAGYSAVPRTATPRIKSGVRRNDAVG